MTDFITILTTMGEHFPLIAVGCLEAVAGIVLIGKNIGRTSKKKAGSTTKGSEKTALQEIGRQKEGTFLILRREDLMPVSAGENLKEITGITFQQLKTDVTGIKKIVKDQAEGKRMWDAYRAWDGADMLKGGFQIQNGEWLQVTIERSRDNIYDLMVFRNVTEIQKIMKEYREKIDSLKPRSCQECHMRSVHR